MSATVRRTRSLSTVLAAVLLVLGAGGTASADSDPVGGPGQTTIETAPDTPEIVITCDINAAKPNYSGHTVTGVGYMSKCTPKAPDTCRTETDLLRYYPGPGTWEVVASTPARPRTAPARRC